MVFAIVDRVIINGLQKAASKPKGISSFLNQSFVQMDNTIVSGEVVIRGQDLKLKICA